MSMSSPLIVPGMPEDLSWPSLPDMSSETSSPHDVSQPYIISISGSCFTLPVGKGGRLPYRRALSNSQDAATGRRTSLGQWFRLPLGGP